MENPLATPIDLDDFRPVWRVVKGKCRLCATEAIAVQHADAPPDASECPRCGEMTWAITHYETDGALRPRLEVARG